MAEKPPPIWQAKLAAHRQRFPGDGFNHELKLPSEHRAEPEMPCPCGTKLAILGFVFREHRQCDVVTCPTCESWHAIIWDTPAPQLFSSHE